MKMKDKRFGKGIALVTAAASLLMFGACEKDPEPVSAEEAYAQLKTALTTTVETNELYASIQGNVTIRTTEGTENESSSAETTESKNKIDVVLQMKTDESDKITEKSIWIKLLEEDGSGLIIENYYKDGNDYSYSNFITESYSYTENSEPDTFDPTDIDSEELVASIDKASTLIPAPKATVANGEYTLVWTVNNENLKQYVEAYYRIQNENATDAEIAEQTNAIAENVTIGKELSLTVTIQDGIIVSAAAVFDVTYNGSVYQGSVAFTMSVQNVTVSYPEGRLEEIKEKSEN